MDTDLWVNLVFVASLVHVRRPFCKERKVGMQLTERDCYTGCIPTRSFLLVLKKHIFKQIFEPLSQ
jgi:hypothetical protein